MVTATQNVTLEEWIAQGMAAYGRGEISAAGECFRSALSIDARHSDALSLYGAVCLAENRFAEAVSAIQKGLDHYPSHLPAMGKVLMLNNLGNGFQSMEMNDKAEAAYRQAIAIFPEQAEVWNNLANLLAQSPEPSRRNQAAEAYHNALRFQSNFPAASANLAYFWFKQGNHLKAIETFADAIAQNPNRAAEFMLTLASCHKSLGDIQKYREILATAVALLISNGQSEPAVYRAYGLALQETAKTAEEVYLGLEWIVRGLILPSRPSRPSRKVIVEDLLDLALGQANLRDWAAADATMAEAMSLEPDNPPEILKLWFMRARLAELRYDYLAAIADYRHLLSLDPSLDSARLNLGNCLVSAARGAAGTKVGDDLLAQAKNEFQQILAGQESQGSERIAPLLGLATAQHFLGESTAALASLEAARQVSPHHPLVLFNRANILQDQEDFAAAIAGFQQIVSLYPDYHDARWNLAFAQLASGDYRQGFKEFEVRWRRPSGLAGLRQFDQPALLESSELETGGGRRDSLAGKTLLVHAEQGLGDSLQFCRFVPILLGLGVERVIFEVQPPLLELMTESFADYSPRLQIVARAPNYPKGDGLPSFDVHIPLMSLPLVFGTELATVPAAIPYLKVASNRADHWRDRITALAGGGRKIGLVWAGECRRDIPLAVETDRLRSIALAEFTPWIEKMTETGTKLVSLQLGPARSQISHSPHASILIDPMDEVHSFADTAAILMSLDGLISVDTSVAHAAGGIGIPVTLLSRHRGCWRWLAGREDSPWYPKLRVIHQARPMEWRDEIARL